MKITLERTEEILTTLDQYIAMLVQESVNNDIHRMARIVAQRLGKETRGAIAPPGMTFEGDRLSIYMSSLPGVRVYWDKNLVYSHTGTGCDTYIPDSEWIDALRRLYTQAVSEKNNRAIAANLMAAAEKIRSFGIDPSEFPEVKAYIEENKDAA